jgi:hypothetical protein
LRPKKEKKKKKEEEEDSAQGTMKYSSSGYVVVPRLPTIFYGTNYADLATSMRFHIRGF